MATTASTAPAPTEASTSAAKPVDYFRGSIAYKKHIIGVYVQRGLRASVRRALEEE